MRLLSFPLIIVIAFVASPAFGDVVELYWDDGIPYVPHFHNQEGDGWGVRFEPTGPGLILQAKIYVGNPPPEDPPVFQGCNISLYYDDGGFPADEPFWGPVFFETEAGWNYFTISTYCNGNNFYVAWIQVGYAPDCDAVYADPYDDNHRSLRYLNGIWDYYDFGGDLLIRCFYDYPPPAVQPISLGKVKALFN